MSLLLKAAELLLWTEATESELKALKRHGRKSPNFKSVLAEQTAGRVQNREDFCGEGQAGCSWFSHFFSDIAHLFLIVQSIKVRVDKQNIFWLEVSVSQLVVM